MVNKTNQYSIPITILLIVIALAVGISTYLGHLKEIRRQIDTTFTTRNDLVQNFINLQRDRVSVMSRLFTERYLQTSDNQPFQFEINALSGQHNWQLATPSHLSEGVITGNAPLPLSSEIKREITAAFAIDPQIKAAFNYDPDIIWVYYQSANQFIYLAPGPIDQFRFTADIYKERYWLDALPESNKARRMILAGPYKDSAGRGWVITFAEPAYYKDKFLGVTALDLSVDTLNNLIRTGNALGTSMIISKHDRLMAAGYDFQSEVSVHFPRDQMRTIQDGYLYLSRPIVDNEIWLIHQVKIFEIYLSAAKNSLGTWLIIVMLGLVLLLGWKLKYALDQVTRIIHIDPLTQTLNRRGFYEQFAMLMNLAKRRNFMVAILVIDVDHFKRINDDYGHHAGDQVLKALGESLINSVRPYDLVCRWGGEEFVIALLLEAHDHARQIADRIIAEAHQVAVEANAQPITISGGMVVVQKEESMEEAIKRADTLLYQAKNNGRNQLLAEI